MNTLAHKYILVKSHCLFTKNKKSLIFKGTFYVNKFLSVLRDRLMVGLLPLEQGILVRIQVPQYC